MKHPIIISSDGKIKSSDAYWRYIGSLPIRTELEILPPDTSSAKGWKIEKFESISNTDKSFFKKIKKLIGY